MAYEVLLLTQFLAASLMLLLAAGVLWIDPRRSVHRALALMLLLNALVVLANQGPRFQGPESARYWFSVSQYFLIALPFAVAYLVIGYAARPTRAMRAIKGLVLVAAVAVELLYAFDHRLAATFATDGRVQLGPLSLLRPATLLAFGLAGFAFSLELLRRPSGPRQSAAFLASVAFTIQALLETALPLAAFVHRGADGLARFLVPSIWTGASTAIQFLSLVPVAASFCVYLISARRNRPRRITVVAIAVLALLAPATAAFAEWGVPEVNRMGPAPGPGSLGLGDIVLISLVGLWRVFLPGLLAYALVKYKLFGVELRMKAAIRQATIAVAFALAYVLAFSFLVAGGVDRGLSALVALAPPLLMAPAISPLRRAGDRLADQFLPSVEASSEYLARRKFELYLAALEETRARVSSPADEAFLEDLRRRLGINQEEHRIVELAMGARDRFHSAGRPETDERFRPERELGRGSQRRAVLAHDRVLDRSVVLLQPLVPWVLDEAGREHFLQEARAAARVRHPNVVTVYEVRPQDEPPTLILEYVEGGNLKERVERGRIPLDDAVRFVLGILAGLEAIHRAGILHRDLKPANILVDSAGVAKVTDFGVAAPPEAWGGAYTRVFVGPQPGSPAYMSPEQARGEALTAASDVYSVGCILHELLTGRPPAKSAGGQNGESRGTTFEGRGFHGIPQAFQAVLDRSLAARPDRRYGSARAMARALQQALEREGDGVHQVRGRAARRPVRLVPGERL